MQRIGLLSLAGCGILLLTAQAPVQDTPEQTCRKGIVDVEAALPKATDARAKRKAEGELREMKRAVEDKQWADCLDSLDEARQALRA
ncbi:MAG: hypothetical protein EXQ88_01710 [Alphaproteobacteria bacterium]|nr:hypothetical protein [Alphaproteobacteria bacterium]